MDKQHENPLGVEPINHLMARFAIPSIIAMLVSALYNMVDQFFIGHSVGMQGNAATNVAFPLTITCTAVSLLFGIGGVLYSAPIADFMAAVLAFFLTFRQLNKLGK